MFVSGAYGEFQKSSQTATARDDRTRYQYGFSTKTIRLSVETVTDLFLSEISYKTELKEEITADLEASLAAKCSGSPLCDRYVVAVRARRFRSS